MIMKQFLIGIVMFLGMIVNANAGLLVDDSAAVVDKVVDDSAAVVDESVSGVEDVTGNTLKTTDNVVEGVL